MKRTKRLRLSERFDTGLKLTKYNYYKTYQAIVVHCSTNIIRLKQSYVYHDFLKFMLKMIVIFWC